MPPRPARPTPRSAPAVAFLQVTHDSAEVTEIPPPKPTSRLPLIIAAAIVVVVGGAMWFARMSAPGDTERLEAVGADTLGGGNIFKAAVGGAASTESAVAVASPNDAVHRFTSAITLGSMDSLAAVAPGLTAEQQKFWTGEFARAGFIEAPVEIGTVNVSGDSARADFVIDLKVLDKNTKQESSTKLAQHALLVRKGAAWQIAAIR